MEQTLWGIVQLVSKADLVNCLQLVKDGTTNIVDGHLKGAMSVIAASEESPDDTGVFLERVCIAYPPSALSCAMRCTPAVAHFTHHPLSIFHTLPP